MTEPSPSISSAFRLAEHPDRAFVDLETHARPVMPIDVPVRVRRAAFMPYDGHDGLARLQETLVARLRPGDHRDTRQFDFEAAGYRVIIEIHNEFATLTWVGAIDDWTSWPEGISLDLFSGMPLIAATRIDLIDAAVISPGALAGFNPPSLSYSAIFDGTAQAATDFVVGEDRFTRFEVAAGRSGKLQRGVIVRRLLEIETYRNLALLGLPLARTYSPRIRAQEAQQVTLMQQLGHGTTMQDNHAALDSLHDLSLEVGRTVDAVAYRFAASHAYANVLRSRVERLDEKPIGEFTTIARYLENRVEPAMATLTAVEKRLDALADRLERSTDLLNARITLSIEQQNQTVLDTISRTARSQYMLQRTVEGLSIVAISYYALGIIGHVLDGFPHLPLLGAETTLAIAAPVVILLVWWLLRRRAPPHE
jgi:uncharacterized membrane-anchored protein